MRRAAILAVGHGKRIAAMVVVHYRMCLAAIVAVEYGMPIALEYQEWPCVIQIISIERLLFLVVDIY